MRKGSKATLEQRARMKEANKDSIIKAGKARLLNYKNKHPKRDENPYLYLKSRNLLRDFGITLNDYNNLLNKQNGKCAICNGEPNSKNKTLGVDHCHNTGRVRGLLCDKCNRGLGLFLDNIDLLGKAIKYLANA